MKFTNFNIFIKRLKKEKNNADKQFGKDYTYGHVGITSEIVEYNVKIDEQ